MLDCKIVRRGKNSKANPKINIGTNPNQEVQLFDFFFDLLFAAEVIICLVLIR